MENATAQEMAARQHAEDAEHAVRMQAETWVWAELHEWRNRLGNFETSEIANLRSQAELAAVRAQGDAEVTGREFAEEVWQRARLSQ